MHEMDPPETELLQRNPLDLGQLLLCQLVLEAVAGEEVEADPRGHATRSALPLQRVGPRNPRVLQALRAFGSVVPAGGKKKKKSSKVLASSIYEMKIKAN